MKALEFDVILARISAYAMTKTTKESILSLTPICEVDEIKEKLNQTQEALTLIFKFGRLPLIEDFDIHSLLNAIAIGQSLYIKDILSLRLFLVMTENVITYKKDALRQKFEFQALSFLFELASVNKIIQAIEAIMDPDGVILDSASDTLYTIRRQIRKLEKDRRDILNQLLQKRSKELNEMMIVTRNDRYCLPVKAEFKHSFKGIIHDESASGTTAFIEPLETIDKTIEIDRLHFAEQQEIIRIIDALIDEIKPDAPILNENLSKLIDLDFIQSKALYAKEIDAYMPNINQQGIVELVNARHPLIDPKVVVPISLVLNEEKKTIMITGPNTGGKTVALKTVGLLSILVQSGILVPADKESKFAIFDGIYADIGDEQSIIQSLSTFSSHLTKIQKIVNEVKDNVLILFDELGSGTDPQEGSALAMGILDYLADFDIRMIVTTHYSELKIYAYSHPHIANASVAFDTETLKPLYRINYGISGASNALTIATKLGLKQAVIDLATNYTTLKENDLTKSIKTFEEESLRVKEKENKLSQLLKQLEIDKKELEFKLFELESSKDKILTDTKKLADKQLKETLKKAEELIEILSMKDLKDHEIASIKYDLKQLGIQEVDIKDSKQLVVGDYVYIKSYDQTGIITNIQKHTFTVKFGMFELPFKQKDLIKTNKPIERTKQMRQTYQESQKTFSDAKMELDLRGFRFEDVKEALEKFLDTATLNHLRSVRIIHGFGTGAVRKAVQDVLKKSPYVTEYRFGGEGEGLNGVTVATLK